MYSKDKEGESQTCAWGPAVIETWDCLEGDQPRGRQRSRSKGGEDRALVPRWQRNASRATPLPPVLTANQGGRGTVAVARVQADHQDSLKGSRRERRADGDGHACGGERLYIGGDLRFVHTVCVDRVDPLVVGLADII